MNLATNTTLCVNEKWRGKQNGVFARQGSNKSPAKLGIFEVAFENYKPPARPIGLAVFYWLPTGHVLNGRPFQKSSNFRRTVGRGLHSWKVLFWKIHRTVLEIGLYKKSLCCFREFFQQNQNPFKGFWRTFNARLCRGSLISRNSSEIRSSFEIYFKNGLFSS